MRPLLLILVAILALAGCGSGGDGDQPNLTGPTTPVVNPIVNAGPCSLIVIIAGNPTVVRGDRGSTVTTGNLQITFGPDCSARVETTTTNPAPA